jgi:excisionase family DNA binding protein
VCGQRKNKATHTPARLPRFETADNNSKANPMEGENLRRLWGPKELAHYLGVSERTAIKRMAHGDLPGFRIGKLWRIRPGDVLGTLRPQVIDETVAHEHRADVRSKSP